MVSRIKELCKQQGTSIAKLEKKLGFGNGVIARWKTSNPSYERLSKVAKELGTSVEYLQTGEPEKEKPTPVSGDGLSSGEAKLLTLFRQVPEESQQMVIGMIEGALKNLGLLE